MIRIDVKMVGGLPRGLIQSYGAMSVFLLIENKQIIINTDQKKNKLLCERKQRENRFGMNYKMGFYPGF